MKDKKKQNQKAKRPSTQTHLPIAEIKDGAVVLKDGTLRKVLIVSSINFALKSEDEQNALISSYVGFLNSIDFPLQIVIQSRRLQIQPYLDKLIAQERKQLNELLRVQTADYRAFVEELVQIGQIMTKKFYVTVPFDPVTSKKRGFFARFGSVIRPSSTIRLKEERFQKHKEDLDMRVRQVAGGLQSIGLEVAELDTQSLVELYYQTYNPDVAFHESLAPMEQIQIEAG